MKGIVLLLVIFGIISMSAGLAAEDRQPVYRWFNSDTENNAYDHFYTIDPNEDPTELGYTSEGIAFYTGKEQFHPDAVRLLRLWHESNSDHFYTIDQGEADDAVANLGYVLEEDKDLGWVLPAEVDYEDAVPLYRYFCKPEHVDMYYDHFYTVNPDDEDLDHYDSEGIACKVFAGPGIPAVEKQIVYRWWNSDTENNAFDHLYTIDRDEDPTELGYTYEGAVFETAKEQFHPDAVRLLRLWHESNSDHFYTIDQDEADDAVANLGYVLEEDKDLGWVLPEGVDYEDAIPLYRYFCKPEHVDMYYDHFYTVNPDDEDLDHYDYEGIACQVFSVSLF